MSELEKYEPDELRRLAVEYAESGLFTDARKAETALVKIYAGAELGLGPFQSMSGVHLIQGKPVVGAGLLASLLDRDPDYDYSVQWEPNPAHPEACTITVFKHGKERGVSRFSLEDAQRAGLSGGNWQKYPSAMLFARAISQAVRWYAPGATGTSVYVEGEITADVEAVIPEGVTAKPRTRVTAEVIPDPPVEHVEAEDVEYEPVTMPSIPQGELRKALSNLNQYQKDTLFLACGLNPSVQTPLKTIRAHMCAKWIELELPDFEGEPVPVTLLAAIYRDEADKGNAEAFDILAKTGQDVDPGDQIEFDEVMT